MKWKTISIFISSTFNDMHAERDYIRKVLIPRLNNALAKHRICVQATDLRWGISTTNIDEEEREAKVLHVCLNAIKNNRPYFIALIGDRYGWIPPTDRVNKILPTLDLEERTILEKTVEEVSVTEMEILLGALGQAHLLEHSFFCLREIINRSEIPSALRPTYFDIPESKSFKKLSFLKQRILEACMNAEQEHRILRYSATWNNHNEKIAELDKFGESLFNMIVADIESYTVLQETDKDEYSVIEQENEALENFINRNVMNFIGRETLLKDLIGDIYSRQSAKGVLSDASCKILTGFSGSGKSFVFSALCDRLTQKAASDKLILLTHAAGITQDSTSTRSMLYRWCNQLLKVLNDSSSILPEDSAKKFPALILRVQAQGFFPIVIIDSLDSFKTDPDHLLRKLDLFPYTVPVICTTLPDNAKPIVAQNPNCQAKDMDCFSRQDALDVISNRLKSNNKELTEMQIEAILGKRCSNGRPAYESPLWLQMTLSILMELGSEDFHNIHKQEFDQEDRKIEAYLNHVISLLPSEPDRLFAYFISLTSKYFNPDLTTKALSLIAISMDGIDDNLLAESIGNDWNALEFTSLQYWMRDFIYRDVQTGKWRFTHNILKRAVHNLNPSLIEEMTGELLDYFEKRVNESKDELGDYVYLLLEGKYYERLSSYILSCRWEKLYSVAEAICKIYEKAGNSNIYEFLSYFLDLHYLHKNTEPLMADIIDMLVNRERMNPSEGGVEFIVPLSRLLSEKFTQEEIFSGNPALLSAYLDSISLRLSVDNSFDILESYTADFNLMIEVYLKNKALYGHGILSDSLLHPLFYRWYDYIRAFYYRNRDDQEYTPELISMLDSLFDELDWYYDNLGNFLSDFHDYYSVGDALLYLVPDYYNRYELSLPIDKADSYLHRIHGMMMKTYRDEFTDGLMELFFENAVKLVEAYIKNHQPDYFGKVPPFETTPLMEFICYPGYEELHVEMEEKAKKEMEARSAQYNHYAPRSANMNELTQTTEADSHPENQQDETSVQEECVEIDLEEMRKPEYSRHKTWEPTAEIIQKQREALDDLLGHFDLSDRYSDRYNEIIAVYRNLLLSLSEDLILTGEREEALSLLKNAETIFCRPIVEMSSNYVIISETGKNIKELGKFYEKYGEEERAIAMLESIVEAIWHSYYHHISGDGQRWLLNYMDDLYYTYDEVQLLDFRKKRFTIASISHRERMYNSNYHSYEDLWPLRESYNDLFRTYRKEGEVEGCIDLLNLWEDLCLETYQDDRRKDKAVEDFENIDSRLNTLREENESLIDSLAAAGKRLPNGQNALLRCREIWNKGLTLTPFYRESDSKYGFLNHDGEVVIIPKYSLCRPFSGHRAAVAKEIAHFNHKWGFIDENGDEIIKPQYADVGNFSEGLVWVCISKTGNGLGFKGNKFGYIDIAGNIVIPAIYDDASSFINGKALVFKGSEHFYIDPTGTRLMETSDII